MNKTSFLLKIDLRIVCIALLVVIIGMLAFWRPWETHTERRISVTGQSEIEATPDSFVFSPHFERRGTDTAQVKDELNAFGVQLQTKLKELGVKEEDITLGSSSYDDRLARPENGETTVSLTVTIATPNQELAQHVQDYLATTDATGQLTAISQFSEEKRRDLENQARDKAVSDARSKAERTASNLSARLGKVLEVKDATGFSVPPMLRGGTTKAEDTANLPVTPGKDAVGFSVEVVFELR